jgi:phosphatidate cytidylyltransferase
MFYLFVPLYMFLLIPMRMVSVGENEGFLKSCSIIHWGLMTAVYSLGYLAAYLILPIEKNPIGGGVGMLLCILILTVFNDFTQMFFGKIFGKHKIIPKVSPNKTWEGFIGGVISTALLTGLLAPYVTPLTLKQGVFAGFILAIAGFLGDVTMSAIKRDIGVKDTGTLLPGHGGILDRLDSLVFTAPLFFHYTVYLHYMGLIK